MYFDDFIADQILKTNHSSRSHDLRPRWPIRRRLGNLWNGIRRVARAAGQSSPGGPDLPGRK